MTASRLKASPTLLTHLTEQGKTINSITKFDKQWIDRVIRRDFKRSLLLVNLKCKQSVLKIYFADQTCKYWAVKSLQETHTVLKFVPEQQVIWKCTLNYPTMCAVMLQYDWSQVNYNGKYISKADWVNGYIIVGVWNLWNSVINPQFLDPR